MRLFLATFVILIATALVSPPGVHAQNADADPSGDQEARCTIAHPCETDDTFEEGVAQATGVDIFYRVIGNGPPLLLLNGGPGWSSDHMMSVARRLAASHEVILFDQRGTGLSQPESLDSTTISMDLMVEDIEAVRRHLGHDDWIVFGHSFGGMLAMAYAAKHPRPVRALVLSAAAGADMSFARYYQDSMDDRLLPREREAVAHWSDPSRVAANPGEASYEIMRASVGAFLYDRSRLPDMLDVLDETTWSLRTYNLVWANLSRTGFDVRQDLKSFDKPVLVVQGRQDALGDHHPHEIAALFPESTLRIIEKSAHIMWLDQPERYFNIVGDFLAGLSR